MQISFLRSPGPRSLALILTLLLGILFSCVTAPERKEAGSSAFTSAWPTRISRPWPGPDYWANRLQDWRIHQGRLECLAKGPRVPMRTVHLLSRRLAGPFSLQVRTGPVELGKALPRFAWTGFLFGIGDGNIDPRLSAMVHHKPAADGGFMAVVDGRGQLSIRSNCRRVGKGGHWSIGGAVEPTHFPLVPGLDQVGDGWQGQAWNDVELRLEANIAGTHPIIVFSAFARDTNKLLGRATWRQAPATALTGGVALLSHGGPNKSRSGFWFRDFQVKGLGVVKSPEHRYGPILCALHTLSGDTLKLTAQMPPLGKGDNQHATLQIRPESSGSWQEVATAVLTRESFTFPFRVRGWTGERDVPYRVVYDLVCGPGVSKRHYRTGTIRREPREKEALVVAAFTGHKCYTGDLKWNHGSIWFPHNKLVAAIDHHQPDLLFFSGDQVYEGDLSPAQKRPLAKAKLDYLYKWYRWCWAFGDLARTIPCITIPDDHDVYHGNVWGAGGRAANRQDDGGYCMDPSFVRMVERTQTSHLPDPFDPTPVAQGIGVYYTELNYGGVSFAIIEDRKFKSSPTRTVPAGKIVNGWPRNPNFDPARDGDVAGAILLGARQLDFLEHWADHWGDGTWMKVLLSQTIFANVATLPQKAKSDGVVPGLRVFGRDEYPPDDRPVADFDSNGWPQTGRNAALRHLRRAFALHIAGDQHLGSTIHYGIDEFEDAGIALCVPSIGNTFPRRWFPRQAGANRRPGAPLYTGRFKDGFGNHITVHAVSNPRVSGKEPTRLHDRAPGYGIVRLGRKSREITIEVWPRWVDPAKAGAPQYPGWPIKVKQGDNYGRKIIGHLPLIRVVGVKDPLFQLLDAKGRVIYTLRPGGGEFRPPVFVDGTYSIRVTGPGGTVRLLNGLTMAKGEGSRPITVKM